MRGTLALTPALPSYVFSAQRGFVAQICNLLYRRFVIGRASERSSALALADVPQNAILRYSRLQICATLNTHASGCRPNWRTSCLPHILRQAPTVTNRGIKSVHELNPVEPLTNSRRGIALDAAWSVGRDGRRATRAAAGPRPSRRPPSGLDESSVDVRPPPAGQPSGRR